MEGGGGGVSSMFLETRMMFLETRADPGNKGRSCKHGCVFRAVRPGIFLRLLMHFRLCERAFRVAEGVKNTKLFGACGGLTVIFTKL